MVFSFRVSWFGALGGPRSARIQLQGHTHWYRLGTRAHDKAAHPFDDYGDAWMDFDEDMSGFLVAQNGASDRAHSESTSASDVESECSGVDSE